MGGIGFFRAISLSCLYVGKLSHRWQIIDLIFVRRHNLHTRSLEQYFSPRHVTSAVRLGFLWAICLSCPIVGKLSHQLQVTDLTFARRRTLHTRSLNQYLSPRHMTSASRLGFLRAILLPYATVGKSILSLTNSGSILVVVVALSVQSAPQLRSSSGCIYSAT